MSQISSDKNWRILSAIPGKRLLQSGYSQDALQSPDWMLRESDILALYQSDDCNSLPRGIWSVLRRPETDLQHVWWVSTTSMLVTCLEVRKTDVRTRMSQVCFVYKDTFEQGVCQFRLIITDPITIAMVHANKCFNDMDANQNACTSDLSTSDSSSLCYDADDIQEFTNSDSLENMFSDERVQFSTPFLRLEGLSEDLDWKNAILSFEKESVYHLLIPLRSKLKKGSLDIFQNSICTVNDTLVFTWFRAQSESNISVNSQAFSCHGAILSTPDRITKVSFIQEDLAVTEELLYHIVTHKGIFSFCSAHLEGFYSANNPLLSSNLYTKQPSLHPVITVDSSHGFTSILDVISIPLKTTVSPNVDSKRCKIQQDCNLFMLTISKNGEVEAHILMFQNDAALSDLQEQQQVEQYTTHGVKFHTVTKQVFTDMPLNIIAEDWEVDNAYTSRSTEEYPIVTFEVLLKLKPSHLKDRMNLCVSLDCEVRRICFRMRVNSSQVSSPRAGWKFLTNIIEYQSIGGQILLSSNCESNVISLSDGQQVVSPSCQLIGAQVGYGYPSVSILSSKDSKYSQTDLSLNLMGKTSNSLLSADIHQEAEALFTAQRRVDKFIESLRKYTTLEVSSTSTNSAPLSFGALSLLSKIFPVGCSKPSIETNAVVQLNKADSRLEVVFELKLGLEENFLISSSFWDEFIRSSRFHCDVSLSGLNKGSKLEALSESNAVCLSNDVSFADAFTKQVSVQLPKSFSDELASTMFICEFEQEILVYEATLCCPCTTSGSDNSEISMIRIPLVLRSAGLSIQDIVFGSVKGLSFVVPNPNPFSVSMRLEIDNHRGNAKRLVWDNVMKSILSLCVDVTACVSKDAPENYKKVFGLPILMHLLQPYIISTSKSTPASLPFISLSLIDSLIPEYLEVSHFNEDKAIPNRKTALQIDPQNESKESGSIIGLLIDVQISFPFIRCPDQHLSLAIRTKSWLLRCFSKIDFQSLNAVVMHEDLKSKEVISNILQSLKSAKSITTIEQQKDALSKVTRQILSFTNIT